MGQTLRLDQLLEDIRSGSDEAKIAAVKALLELGKFGSPAGAYPLEGAKAALRAWRLADAIVFLHHGLRVAEPHTPLWAELLVNRAIACAHHGFFREAIEAGDQFLAVVVGLSAKTRSFIPYAHHAIGFAYDALKDHARAIQHYRLAAEMHTDPVEQTRAGIDLAYALAMSGDPGAADCIIQGVTPTQDPLVNFGLATATTIIRYQQGRFSEAVDAGERALALASGQEDRWAIPLAETQYWLARAVFELGDRQRSVALALRVEFVAYERWHLELGGRADALLAEILGKGGIE
ncbi:MAG: hypothetical protein ACM3VW_07650 [Bacteroidota bacterium]